MANASEQLLEKQNDLFPRRLSLVAGTLAGVLVAGVALLITTMHGNFDEVHRSHFPVLEMASINVRLANAIVVKAKYGVELSEDVDSLEYAFKEFQKTLSSNSKFASLAAKLPKPEFIATASGVASLLKRGKAGEAHFLQSSPEFQKQSEQFTSSLADLTEALSVARDESLSRELKLIRVVLGAFVLLSLVIGILFVRIFRAYRANLEQRLEAERQVLLLSQGRKALIHVLCHDLGNPVSSIAGLIGFVEKFEGEQRAKAIAMIRLAATNAQGIIDLIRKLQALESGKLALELGEHALSALVQESMDVLRARVDAKGLKLVVEIDPTLRVRVEKTSFVSSVANNVLTNAVKFSQEGSTIELRARAIDGERVELSVRDHGVGMPAELAASVFSELKATSRSGTSGEKGTGFGMPLARKFVVAYGGDIEVVSSEAPADHGTEIKIKLPKAA